MNRNHYLITSSVGHKVIKYAWNSAQLEVEAMVRDIAKSEGTRYALVQKHSVRADNKVHTYGTRKWLSDAGKEINFTITRVVV